MLSDHSLPHVKPLLVDLRVVVSDDHRLITVAGDLDVAAVSTLQDALDSCDPQAGSLLAVDMSAVSFVDSTGYAPILMAQDRWRQAGGELIIARPSQPTRRLIRILESLRSAAGGKAS